MIILGVCQIRPTFKRLNLWRKYLSLELYSSFVLLTFKWVFSISTRAFRGIIVRIVTNYNFFSIFYGWYYVGILVMDWNVVRAQKIWVQRFVLIGMSVISSIILIHWWDCHCYYYILSNVNVYFRLLQYPCSYMPLILTSGHLQLLVFLNDKLHLFSFLVDPNIWRSGVDGRRKANTDFRRLSHSPQVTIV